MSAIRAGGVSLAGSTTIIALLIAAASCRPPSALREVVIEGAAFTPAELVVREGDRVVWTNRDLFPHTATAAGLFDSGEIAPGASWTWTVSGQTTVSYTCTYHPTMQAKIRVGDP